MGVLVLAMQPWRVCPLRPLSAAKPLLLLIDALRDGAPFRLGGFSPTLGIRTVVLDVQPLSQMGAEVLAMAWGLCLILNVGCPVAHMFLDNAVVAFMVLCFRAPVGNLFPQRVFRRLLYMLSKGLKGRIYLHWVRGALNLADPPSTLSPDCDGDRLGAWELARACLRTL